MRNSIFHRFLHLFSYIVSLILVWLVMTTSIPNGHQGVASTRARGRDSNYKCIDRERRALLDFKASIDQDPQGRLSTWTPEEETINDCCEWLWVTCNNETGHVTSLNLRLGELEGKISSSLLNLSYLNYLDLCSNSFGGTIPIFIGSMTQLEYLDLGVNDFTGAIPKSIGSLTQLSFLGLSRNHFTGTIPPEFGNLTNLQVLSLRFLRSCTIENLNWLSNMPKLENLDMSGTSLAKADNWVNVILNLQKLSNLGFWMCNLSQVMNPYSQATVNASSSSILTLDLGDNNLNSSMYYWLYPLTSDSLVQLNLYGNNLDGIPKYFGNLCGLTFFSFLNNSMTVKLPDFLKNLSGCTLLKLKTLSLSGSQFIGSISDDIQKFSSLYYLDVSNNKLNGISEKVWQLPKFIGLDVSSNSIKGDISENIGKSNILIVDLANNSLQGVLSKAHFSNMSSVEKIILSSNNFSGAIPNVSNTLQWLDLSKNKFSGGLSFLCQIINGSLSFLDLSNNSLTGQIPDCLWHFKELQVLNLGYNKLFGRLPPSVESLINLEALYVNNNNFSGELPLSLSNCTNLTFLYLGANGYSGEVPFWIGEKLSLLYALSLKSNNFSGTIPLQLCQLVKLQILDLSMNNLDGTIPTCMSNLTAMVQDGFETNQSVRYYSGHNFTDELVDHVMIQWQGNVREFSRTLRFVKGIDLSSNNLTGKIPYQLTNLYQLLTLNLSNNALLGEIPPGIGQMKNLQILDLSRNNLSGRIPSSLTQMNLLNCLDVSYNKLSGRIPSSTQLQSFEPSRYIGNARLCGLPLSKYCPGDKEMESPPFIGESENDGESVDDLNRWFYIGGAIGFAIGFWTVCSALLLHHRGRHAFFHFMNSLENWVYVKVMIILAKLHMA